MGGTPSFDERVAARLENMSPAERQAVGFFQDNREEVLVASALALATKIGTSDATVIRAVKALGYASLDELRRQLAAELRRNLSPASRLERTLGAVGDETASALGLTLDIHVQAIERLRRDVSAELFHAAVDRVVTAQRVFIFGIGPSRAMADYFSTQLGRFGIDAASLTETGLLLADGLHRLRQGDVLIILAYSRIYRELEALLDHAGRLGIATILLTDTLGVALRKRVDLVLPVARGRADWFSMHTATLALIEALLVGVAATRPAETIADLKLLNRLRAKLVGEPVDLAISDRGQGGRIASKRRKGRS
jgi:DNA-binding MurR/RpiR family transcriptional regulator